MQQTEVTLHGHRMVYRVAGDPNLPVLLMIHGITSSSATWDLVIPALAEHAHVIAPDLLGHGESDKPRTDYSLGGFASGLRDLLEHLGHDRVTIVGHSLGGGVALQFAYQYSEYCERVVLVDSGGLGREVTPALRAATLPGAEFVLPVIANRRVATLGWQSAACFGESRFDPGHRWPRWHAATRHWQTDLPGRRSCTRCAVWSNQVASVSAQPTGSTWARVAPP